MAMAALVPIVLQALNEAAEEYRTVRDEYRARELEVQIKYAKLVAVHHYAVNEGVDAPPLPAPPTTKGFGVRKTARLRKEGEAHLRSRGLAR